MNEGNHSDLGIIFVKVKNSDERPLSWWREYLKMISDGEIERVLEIAPRADRGALLNSAFVGGGLLFGIYDFVLFMTAPSALEIERFVTTTLRARELSDSVIDTLTIVGFNYF